MRLERFKTDKEITKEYKRTREWLGLAFNNLDKVITFYEIKEFAATVFRIQLSTEQLQKALVVLLGLQFRNHEPSKILESIEINEHIKIEENLLEKIKRIAVLSKKIEEEGTATRYGIIIDNKLVSPDEKYDKEKTDEYLDNLNKILIIFKDLFKENLDLEPELTRLSEFIIKIEELDKQ